MADPQALQAQALQAQALEALIASLPPCEPGSLVATAASVTAVTVLLCTFLVLARVYVRIRIVHAFWWDDFAIIVAFVRLL